MKKRALIKIVISVGVIITIWEICRVTGMIQLYKVPTSGNTPNINPGDNIFATNLIDYGRLDFICYDFNDPKFGKGIWIRRVCGLPGDTVKMENGTFFVNGRNMDHTITLKHDYVVQSGVAHRLIDDFTFPFCFPNSDSCRIAIEDGQVTPDLNAHKFINNEKGVLHKSFNQNWSLDNFGPLVVPNGMLFLLGDNRSNSVDSRLTGFTNVEDVVGVVVE